jgi:hypothetical protein|tara:strand:- start:320 stop:664 length:345 start_codon:yes stop_codon:yes gene_type:complete
LKDSGHYCSCFPDDKVNINGGVDLEVGDVLDGRRWAVDINNSLMDSHFISIPGVGSFTAWRLSGGNSENLGWHSHGTLSFVMWLGFSDDVGASGLEFFDLGALEGHSVSNNKRR